MEKKKTKEERRQHLFLVEGEWMAYSAVKTTRSR
jgi:hypothetical protein